MMRLHKDALHWRDSKPFIDVCLRSLFVRMHTDGRLKLCLHEGSYPEIYTAWKNKEID